MGLPDHPWILLFSGRSRTPVPTRSTVILALPSLPKGGWRGVAVTGGFYKKRRSPLMFATQTHHLRSEHHSSYPHSGYIIAKSKTLHDKPQITEQIKIHFVGHGACRRAEDSAKNDGVSQEPRPTHFNKIVSVGEHSMLPKNYIKIRGQMISAPTASNETRAVGRWLAAAVYNRGAAPQLLPLANVHRFFVCRRNT